MKENKLKPIFINADLHHKLKVYATKQGVPMTKISNEMTKNFLKDKES